MHHSQPQTAPALSSASIFSRSWHLVAAPERELEHAVAALQGRVVGLDRDRLGHPVAAGLALCDPPRQAGQRVGLLGWVDA